MKEIPLAAMSRPNVGKEANKKYRREGWIPANLYGKDFKNIPLMVQSKDLHKVVVTYGENVLVQLNLDGAKGKDKSHFAMLKELQRDCISQSMLHADFHKVALNEKITAKLPVHLHGEAEGIKAGGLMEHLIWELEIEAFPHDMPDNINLDVTRLKIGDAIAVKDLALNDNVKVFAPGEEIIVIVHAPKAVAEEAAPAVVVEAKAEPELVAKSEKED
jgi:large subunit ribosomal protein L25